MNSLLRHSLMILVGLLILTTSSPCATPEDYRSRIGEAAGRLKGLEQQSSEGDRGSDSETIEIVKELIPQRESIDWPGGTVETRNSWVGAELDRYRSEKDPDAAGEILTSLIDRLTSLEMRIVEASEAEAAQRSKDEEKQKLAEILKREEYQKPQPKEESLAERWWRRLREWLESVFPSPSLTPGTAESGIGSAQFVFQILLYLAVLGSIAFLIAKFAPLLFRRPARDGSEDRYDRVILGERIRSDESPAGLFSEAEELAKNGEMRAAIRKGYIAMLCELADRKIVTLAQFKTNRDYLLDVKRDEELFENMAGLTRSFENSWYGLKTSGEGDWDQFSALYKATLAGERRK